MRPSRPWPASRLWPAPPSRPSASVLLLSVLGLGALPGCDGKAGDDTGPQDSGPDVHYDEGCITVDGAGGYANLADALTVASEGSTVVLCAGTWAEPLEVTRAVTITGAGIDETFLSGDGTNPALDLTGSNITVSALTVTSPYLGIRASGALITVDAVKYEATGSWSFQSNGATDLVISNSEFVEPTDGAIDIEGGTATISGNTLELPDGYGIQLAAGASGSVTNNVIDGVIANKRNYKDGFGVYVVDSTAALSGNQIAGAGSMDVKVENGTLNASGETWIDSPFGLLVEGGSATVDQTTVTGSTVTGIAIFGDSATVTNTTITTDSTLGCDLTYATWDGVSCGGLLVGTDVEAVVSNVSTSGFNNFGVLVLPYTGTSTFATLDNVTVDDTGRIGVYLFEATTTASNITITHLREPELAIPCTEDGYTYNPGYSVSLYVNTGDLTLSDATLADNAGWGMAIYTARATVGTSTFTGNTCSGVLNLGGALTGSNLTFSGTNTNGMLWDYQGATNLSDSSFTGNHATYQYSYDGGDGHIYTYAYTPAGVDMSLSQSTDVITRCTFSDGDSAIASYGVDLEVTDSTFTGYEADILNAQSNSRTVFEDNTVEDLGGSLLQMYYGDVEFNDNAVGTTRSSTNTSWYYQDDVLMDGYPSTYPSSSQLFYGYGSVTDGGDLIVDGLSVESAWYQVFYLYDCAAELSNVEIGTSGAGAGGSVLSGSWYSVDPLLVIDSMSVESALGGGISLSTSSSGTSSAYVEVSDLDFGSVTGTGFYASGLSEVNLSYANFDETSSDAVQISGRSAGDSVVELDSIMAGAGASAGIQLTNLATATVMNSWATGRTNGLGLDLIGEAVIESNAFTGNSGYGMACRRTTITSCASNDLSENTTGMQDGCSEDCGI